MAPESKACVRARAEFIQRAVDAVRAENNPNDFRLHAYCVLASLGLHMRAEQEGLFEQVAKLKNKEQKVHVLFYALNNKKKKIRVDSMVAELGDKVYQSAFLQIKDVLSLSGELKRENDVGFVLKSVHELKVVFKKQPKLKLLKPQYQFKTFDFF